MFKIEDFHKIGIILVFISFILIFTPFLDYPIRVLTQPLLMGSSKGKDILLFLIMGCFLLFSNIEDWSIIKKIPTPRFFNIRKNTYIKIVFYILLFLALLGILGEVLLRDQLNISLFTIFNAMSPNITSTSILHSHLYKTVFGFIVTSILPFIPSGIHTGVSLNPYIPEYIWFLFVLIPVTMVLMLISMQGKDIYSKIFLSLAYTLGIIGLIDGGFFSTPFIGGIYLLLLIKYDSPTVTYWFKEKTSIKNLGEIDRKNFIVKKISDYKKILIFAIPHIILIIIILLRFTIAFAGSNPEYYEVDIANPSEYVDLTTYDTIKTIETDNHTTIYLDSKYNEMELENSLNKKLEGKCAYYTLSWNTNSYFD